MVFKIISFIYVVSLAFGFATQNQVKDVPFDLKEVINRVSSRGSPTRNPQNLNPSLPTGEFIIDSTVIYFPAIHDQRYPTAAFDGSNYLIIWDDQRNGTSDIYGTRVSQYGILDSIGIPISTAVGWQESPSVAFDGTNYFVVWVDERFGQFCDIFGARVSQSGVVLDPEGIPISTESFWQYSPSVAFDGINYLVVWQDGRSQYHTDIYGSRISQSGEVLDPNGIPISITTEDKNSPSISFDGNNYFVVWDDQRYVNSDIYGTRVSQSGEVLDPNGIPISTDLNSQYSPSVVYGGSNFLIAWEDERNGPLDIYGARVSQTGIVLDSIGFEISTATGRQTSTSIIFDGTNYFLVWQDQRNSNSYDVYGARVNQSGEVIDLNGIPISTAINSQWSPFVAFDNINYLVLWTDERSYPRDIYGARVSRDGFVLDTSGIFFPITPNEQTSSSCLYGDTNCLVVWEERHNGTYYDIYGIRLNRFGSIIDTSSIAISVAPNHQFSPSGAFNSTSYFIVWEDQRSYPGMISIYGTRVDISGNVLDPSGILISSNDVYDGSPYVTSDSTNYLVIWEVWGYYDSDIYGARVNQNGVLLDPNGIAISTMMEYQLCPSASFDGINYFITWEDYRDTNTNIYGARLSQDGIVLDHNGIAISLAENYQRTPSIAYDGINYLVVWADSRNGFNYDIYGARVTPAGTVLDPNGIAISIAPNHQISPSVAFDGSDFFVVWQDNRNGAEYDIYGAKVSQSGAVIEHFPVSMQLGDQLAPVLAHGIDNQLLITYSGWTDSINHRPINSYRIWGKFSSDIGLAEENSSIKMQCAKLFEVYPNPFKSQTAIRFSLSALNKASLKIYDISGKLVKSFTSNNQKLITDDCLIWNGTNDLGEKLPAGVYICRLKTTEGLTQTEELIILR